MGLSSLKSIRGAGIAYATGMADDDITRHYHRGNPESMAAFAANPATERRKQRALVLAYITSQGQSGATSDEAELALSLPHQACSARFTELKKDARIIPAGQRVTRSGRKARVWVDRNTPGPIVLEMKQVQEELF